jgi:hypothetical protein
VEQAVTSDPVAVSFPAEKPDLVDLIDQGYLGHGPVSRYDLDFRSRVSDRTLASCWLCQLAPAGTGPTELCDSCIADLLAGQATTDAVNEIADWMDVAGLDIPPWQRELLRSIHWTQGT